MGGWRDLGSLTLRGQELFIFWEGYVGLWGLLSLGLGLEYLRREVGKRNRKKKMR